MKILVLRFSSIGDIVLTTPVLRCLYRQMPNAEIHYLTKAQYTAVLEHNPYIHRLHTFQHKISEVLATLQQARFDAVIDLHHNLRTAFLTRKLGAPFYAFPKLNIEKWLLVNFKINRLPAVHIVDRYLQCTQQWNIYNDGEGLDYFLAEKDHIDIAAQFGIKEPFIAFAIGGQHATKKLPPLQLAAVCEKLPLPVLLLGGSEDAEAGNFIQERTPHAINACGALKLNQSASVLQQAAAVITHDTGLMHIAAAFRKPIVSIWGNTVPEFGMYPYLPIAQQQQSICIENKTLSCRPCSKIGFERCPKKHFLCMNSLAPDHIAAAAMQFIRG